ncbi:MAG: FxLYD domain-containing protein [Euryarchaeota archaeon]|nr:FxLYD domain-containing protein [Euryarchaeota archaeon]MBU4607596.1 FxLYD domain-containing protein [Euryarchaeota archaeon]MBV1729405.1 FxLYD domain-containing protein [Methanobacterium sp.]MBV1755113.1 FxLYD domain-containing protein [Methanobacterium sp.]MBV1767151.1 FxLYD domain-containing protein [Methanobacterium sp.]
MSKKLIILLLILSVVAISGCTMDTEAEKTFGEKDPATTGDLYLINATGDHYDRNDTMYYFVWGYVGNRAPVPAANVEITAQYFSENGTLIGTNTTTPYRPSTIPEQGESYFYAGFRDPDQKIASYKINLSIK